MRATAAGVLGPATVAGGTPALARALRDPSAHMRGAALDALGVLGAAGRAAWPALHSALVEAAGRELSPGNRRAALAALGTTGAPFAVRVPVLTRATADADANVRVAAVRTLGLLGATTDAGARVALTRALADQDATVRQEAQHALTALHRRGGEDPTPPEPSPVERRAAGGSRAPGC